MHWFRVEGRPICVKNKPPFRGNIRVHVTGPYLDQFRFLGNCPPTPPLTQHFAPSKKQVLMLTEGRGRSAVSQIDPKRASGYGCCCCGRVLSHRVFFVVGDSDEILVLHL